MKEFCQKKTIEYSSLKRGSLLSIVVKSRGKWNWHIPGRFGGPELGCLAAA